MSEKKQRPGDGIRSLRSTAVFRAVNFELYTKPVNIIYNLTVYQCCSISFIKSVKEPHLKSSSVKRCFKIKLVFYTLLYLLKTLFWFKNAVVMGLGLIAIAGCAGYIAYMRSVYEGRW